MRIFHFDVVNIGTVVFPFVFWDFNGFAIIFRFFTRHIAADFFVGQ